MRAVESFFRLISPPVAAMAGFSAGVLALGALGMNMEDVSEIITRWGKVVIGTSIGAGVIAKAIIQPIQYWADNVGERKLGKEEINQMRYAFVR